MKERRISPMPPIAPGVGLPWDVAVEDPVAALGAARQSLGDTFVVESGEDRYLFTFSPTGVKSFYGLVEEQASKGVADWRMLRRKLPDEIFLGRRVVPHLLFGRDDVADYLANVERALAMTVDELADSRETELFGLTRRLGHRVGLASWGGPGSATGERFERLCTAFDVLDGAESFVHPEAMQAVASSGKAKEAAALALIAEDIGLALDQLTGHEAAHPLFARVVAAWEDAPDDERATGVAMDVTLIHIASMSNLFAALGWVLVDLIAHPEELARIRAGDRALAEACCLESTRLAQRSIMARYVLTPVVLDVGDASHDVSPGVTIATLLSLTNTSAGPGLDEWRPSRWNKRRMAEPAAPAALAATELVTVFGHGRHTCPAQPYSLAAMTATINRLFGAFAFEAGGREPPRPVPSQIGGVARAASPCPVTYTRRPAD